MLIDQIATLLTQLLVHYLPFNDISVKITCGVAVTTILITTINYIYNNLSTILRRKLNFKDNYMIIENNSKLYRNFIQYLYDKYANETKGCKMQDYDGLFDILIEELNHGELTDNFKDHAVYISFQNSNQPSNKEEDKKDISHKNIILRCKEKMKILEDYVKHIIRTINSNKNRDLHMYKLKVTGNKKKERYISWVRNKFITNKTMENTIVTEQVKKLYYDDLNKFINDKDKYYKKGIPYKRGYLLHGEPGCGKTSLIKAVAHDLNLPIFMLDLSALLDNSELMAAMNELNYHINSDEPYLLVFEDLDRTKIFKYMTNDRYYGYEDDGTNTNHGITQDCILNILDGIDECHGRITIITTNDVIKVKKFKSLIRPGRIDISINITYCTIDQIKRILQYYFDDCNLETININENVTITPAQLLQLMYLLNNINKVVHMLNNTKHGDFTDKDIEKEIFNIKWDNAEENKQDNENQLIDPVSSTIVNSNKPREKKIKVQRKYYKKKSYKSRLVDRNLRRIDYMDRLLDKNKKSISLTENKLDKYSEIQRLGMECSKLKLKMMELKKEKLLQDNVKLEEYDRIISEKEKEKAQIAKQKALENKKQKNKKKLIKTNDKIIMALGKANIIVGDIPNEPKIELTNEPKVDPINEAKNDSITELKDDSINELKERKSINEAIDE